MEVIHFQHTKSQKSLGIMFLVWAAVWPILPVGFLYFHGKLNELLTPWVIMGALGVDAILIAIAIWNLKKGGVFYYKVGNESVECQYPARPDVSYKILIDQIDYLYRKMIHSSDGSTAEYYIVEKTGARNLIPMAYMLPVSKVIKAIQKIRPDLVLKDSKSK